MGLSCGILTYINRSYLKFSYANLFCFIETGFPFVEQICLEFTQASSSTEITNVYNTTISNS